ncbi:MAG: hypothetical protein U1E70_21600 [Acetobacteraceae bacterium]|nr:hypothetical protein [Pseudomonadota bacterium]
MPPRRKPRPAAPRKVMPSEVPETAKSAPQPPPADDDLLPDDLRKMLEAAYT